ncbi:MAG: MFS transporter [Chloroflexi bacterium]|nr:MFS transporter [Chloroflexota bacterium]MCY3938035.1 MFS transporter [Chloroflexota bacterium]
MRYLRAFTELGVDARYLIAASTVRSVTSMGILGVLLNLYVIRLGYGPAFIGLLNGLAIVAAAGASPVAGGLGRRWGARRTMLTGLGIGAVGGLLLPFADLLPEDLIPGWLVVANSVAFSGGMLFYVNLTPYLGVVTAPRERSAAFSVRFSLQWLGSGLGSMIGGVLPGAFAFLVGESLSGPGPYRYSLLFGAVLSLAAVLFLLRGREVSAETDGGRSGSAGPTPWRLLILVGLVSLMLTPAEAAAWVFFNAYADTILRATTSQIGLTVAAAQFLGVPVALTMPAVASRLGTGRAAATAAFGIALSLLPVALIPHFAAAGLGYVGILACGAILAPALNVYLTEIASSEWLSSATGASLLGTTVSFALAAFGGGYLITILGYREFFIIAAALTVAGVLVFRVTLLRASASSNVEG